MRPERGVFYNVIEEQWILLAASQKCVDFVGGIQQFLPLDGTVLPVAIDNTLPLNAGWIADALFVTRVGCDTAGITSKAVNWREIRSHHQNQHQRQQAATDGDGK